MLRLGRGQQQRASVKATSISDAGAQFARNCKNLAKVKRAQAQSKGQESMGEGREIGQEAET